MVIGSTFSVQVINSSDDDESLLIQKKPSECQQPQKVVVELDQETVKVLKGGWVVAIVIEVRKKKM